MGLMELTTRSILLYNDNINDDSHVFVKVSTIQGGSSFTKSRKSTNHSTELLNHVPLKLYRKPLYLISSVSEFST